MQTKPWLIVAALALAGPAQAVYKIVGPDGKVTYTDLPPPGNPGQVTTLSSTGANRSTVQLPMELRQAVSRFPVTLYTTPNCGACDQGRQLLRQRGVPYVEKTVQSDADRDAWAGIVGGSDAPALRVGSQMVRALVREEWNSYLDAAGYPQQSKLPPNYEYPAAEPLVERQPPRATPAPPQRATTPSNDTPPSGIKF
jgi:glutaredoxin